MYQHKQFTIWYCSVFIFFKPQIQSCISIHFQIQILSVYLNLLQILNSFSRLTKQKLGILTFQKVPVWFHCLYCIHYISDQQDQNFESLVSSLHYSQCISGVQEDPFMWGGAIITTTHINYHCYTSGLPMQKDKSLASKLRIWGPFKTQTHSLQNCPGTYF